MTHFLLLPGGGGAAYVWRHVVTELTARGHVALAVDLSAEDPATGPTRYAEEAAAAAAATAPEASWTVVGMSLGAFTAPLLVPLVPVEALVLVNPMVPTPGETAGAWWAATGQGEAMRSAAARGGYSPEFDLEGTFLHDVDPAERPGLDEAERNESDGAFAEPFALAAWPDVPTRVVASADDRLFPADFVRRVARERLGPAVPVAIVPGGHLSPLSQPRAVTEALLAG